MHLRLDIPHPICYYSFINLTKGTNRWPRSDPKQLEKSSFKNTITPAQFVVAPIIAHCRLITLSRKAWAEPTLSTTCKFFATFAIHRSKAIPTRLAWSRAEKNLIAANGNGHAVHFKPKSTASGTDRGDAKMSHHQTNFTSTHIRGWPIWRNGV